MFRKIAVIVICVLVVSIAAVLGYAATLPDTFHVARTVSIKAPPEQIFPLINNLQSNVSWSPFEKDPAMKRTFGAIKSGQGATYAWEGNSDVGAGDIEIIEATVPSKVTLKLNMLQPMEATNIVEFTLVPAADGATDVTWAMHGEQPFLAKVVATFMDCEKMVGDEFEKGLANLKRKAEAA
jgi:uncharacterized protein YndB with AHSA1/START domain